MPKITYIEYGGREHQVEVPSGLSVMRGAVDNNIPGIDADCGGECACATCHVYVREDYLPKLPEMELGEDAMLDGTASPRRPNSRLSCQLVTTPQMDGLVVDMPETQT